MYYIGLDIGGTKIKGVVFDVRSKRVKKEITLQTPKNKKSFLSQIEKIILELRKGVKIKGIGVGLPGIVDYTTGKLIKAPNLPFLNGWNVKKELNKFKIPVKIENDSRCFLLAEYFLGAAKGYQNIVGLTVGTGIGGGIVINGKIYRGKNNGAGEFGHMITQTTNKKLQTFEQLGGKKAFFKYGDRSEIIGVGAANLINALDPDIVVLGGGGISNGTLKINTIQKTAKKHIMSPPAKKTRIIKGKLGDKAQAVGAALLLKGFV